MTKEFEHNEILQMNTILSTYLEYKISHDKNNKIPVIVCCNTRVEKQTMMIHVMMTRLT